MMAFIYAYMPTAAAVVKMKSSEVSRKSTYCSLQSMPSKALRTARGTDGSPDVLWSLYVDLVDLATIWRLLGTCGMLPSPTH